MATCFDRGDSLRQRKFHRCDPIDRVSSRPDFAILGYPVITFEPPYAHSGSAKNLLGENPDPKLVEELSNERHVTAQTPPTFLFSTSEDTVVPPENSVAFYAALHRAGVPAEMHIFEKGPHGSWPDLGDPVLSEWPPLLAHWLRARGLLHGFQLGFSRQPGLHRCPRSVNAFYAGHFNVSGRRRPGDGRDGFSRIIQCSNSLSHGLDNLAGLDNAKMIVGDQKLTPGGPVQTNGAG